MDGFGNLSHVQEAEESPALSLTASGDDNHEVHDAFAS